MRLTLCLYAALALAPMTLPARAAAPEPVVTVESRAADGTRFYKDSLVIRAPAKVLWSGLTDPVQYRRWAAPVSRVDFRLGGEIEASYDPKGHLGDPDNIRNAIIAYLPERLLVFRNVQAPAALPARELYPSTVKIVEFEPLGPDLTRVSISGVGFGDGPKFDQLYRFFVSGDGEQLKAMRAAYETPAH